MITVVQTVFFVGVVARMLGKWAPIGMVGYFGVVTVMLQAIMPNYKQLVKEATELEGKFKFVHTRVKACAESIAFFGGDTREYVVVDRRFQKLMDLVKRKIKIDLQFGLVNTIITEDMPGQIQWMLRMAYGVFQAGSDADIIADKGASMNKNQLLLLTANGQVFEGLRRMFACEYTSSPSSASVLQILSDRLLVLTDIEKFASLSGFIARLAELDEVLTDLSKVESVSDGEYKTAETNELVFDGVDIVTPAGKCLAKAVSCKITPDTPLMVTGANAVGKTSFFRVLGGLWPVRGGSLTVPAKAGAASPSIGEIFLVPQRIYMCIGTLADQVTYPHRVKKEDRTEKQEAEMMELLELVGIGYLVERWQKGMKEGESGWDYETKWECVHTHKSTLSAAHTPLSPPNGNLSDSRLIVRTGTCSRSASSSALAWHDCTYTRNLPLFVMYGPMLTDCLRPQLLPQAEVRRPRRVHERRLRRCRGEALSHGREHGHRLHLDLAAPRADGVPRARAVSTRGCTLPLRVDHPRPLSLTACLDGQAPGRSERAGLDAQRDCSG